jgi:hypothetical protein
MMKKYLAPGLIFLVLVAMLAGCRRSPSPDAPSGTSSGNSALSSMTLSQIVDKIYENHPMELPLGTVEVDLTDSYAVKAYLGLDSTDKITEAVASESMLGAQAYSLVLCRVKNAADAQSVARQMRDGIDQRKWVCVMADDIMVSACGDVVMLVMISSDYAQNGTAESLTQAFKKVCGTDLSVQIR